MVSLCRLGSAEVPAAGVDPGNHLEVWLIDAGSADNPNLDFVIDDTARAVRALRTEGNRVLLHCVQAESRTPTIAARYTTLTTAQRLDEALADLRVVLPRAHPNPAFTEALSRLCPQ